MSACFADVTSATLTWDILHALLRLLGVSNPVFMNVPRSVIFGFENGPDIETVSNKSEFFGDTLNKWDNDSVLVCCT
jgi:hypothetical protein